MGALDDKIIFLKGYFVIFSFDVAIFIQGLGSDKATFLGRSFVKKT